MIYEPNGWNKDLSMQKKLECTNCHNKFNTLNNFINTETKEEVLLCDKYKAEIIKK
jgi:NAD-dependent SIR2 family protein deacetylase